MGAGFSTSSDAITAAAVALELRELSSAVESTPLAIQTAEQREQLAVRLEALAAQLRKPGKDQGEAAALNNSNTPRAHDATTVPAKATELDATAVPDEIRANEAATAKPTELQDGDKEKKKMAALAEAAAAAMAEALPYEDDKSEEAWKELGGASFEAELRVDEALGGSPVRLVDARFIIELERQGGILVRRQDLPESAFLSLEQIKRLPKGGNAGDCLRVISTSQ